MCHTPVSAVKTTSMCHTPVSAENPYNKESFMNKMTLLIKVIRREMFCLNYKYLVHNIKKIDCLVH